MSAQLPEVQPEMLFVSLRSKDQAHTPQTGPREQDEDHAASAPEPQTEPERETDAAPETRPEPQTDPEPHETAAERMVGRFGDRLELIEHMLGQCIEDVAAMREPGSPLSRSLEAAVQEQVKDLEARLAPDLDARICALEDRLVSGLGALAADLAPAPQTGPSEADRLAAQIHTELEQMEARLAAIAARPAPRLDMSDQHQRTAQILTAITTISHRQEAVMEQIEHRLAAFTAEQVQHQAQGTLAQMQAPLDTRLQSLESMLKTVVSGGQEQAQVLAGTNRTLGEETRNVMARLDALAARPELDTDGLIARICTAVQDNLPTSQPMPASAEDDTIAPDLVRCLRRAVAEILAEHLRQNTPRTASQAPATDTLQ